MENRTRPTGSDDSIFESVIWGQPEQDFAHPVYLDATLGLDGAYAAGSAGAMYQHHDHAMNELPAGRAAVIMAITFAVLLGVVWLTSFVVPVRF
jgi:hypothetical protein